MKIFSISNQYNMCNILFDRNKSWSFMKHMQALFQIPLVLYNDPVQKDLYIPAYSGTYLFVMSGNCRRGQSVFTETFWFVECIQFVGVSYTVLCTTILRLWNECRQNIWKQERTRCGTMAFSSGQTDSKWTSPSGGSFIFRDNN